MGKISLFQNKKALHAVYIGFLCSMSYLAVYFARNILSVSSPQMIEGGYTKAYIGEVVAVYNIFYAIGQLINGAIGDRVKARYMISIGLLMAGVSNFVFSRMAGSSPDIARYVYGMTGFFLAMIYAPMMKVVAENTEPIYATRCSLGFTFASFFGSPLAGVIASVFVWQSVFGISSVALGVMAVLVFFFFLLFEKKELLNIISIKPKKKISWISENLSVDGFSVSHWFLSLPAWYGPLWYSGCLPIFQNILDLHRSKRLLFLQFPPLLFH